MLVKNILIICWDFPPNNGIGGRRWAKIAKQLVKYGYDIDVICKEYDPSQPISPWVNDVKELSDRVHYLKPTLLSQWISSKNSVKVRVASKLLKLMYSGTIYDKAIGLQSSFLKLAQGLLEQKKIQSVFVTGAPFNLMFYSALLKTKFPRLEILCDYRDPWITAQNYGMQNLTSSRMNYEKAKQNIVIENSSVITCPNEYLSNEIKQTYSGNKTIYADFKVLPHFYDEDDKIEFVAKGSDNVTRFVYAGTIYLGCDKYLMQLNETITNYRRLPYAKKIEFCFYVNEMEKAKCFEENSDIVLFHKPIGNKIFKEIANSNYVIILLGDHNKNYLTSKFFEYLPYMKPYFYVGPRGYVSETISREGLGVITDANTELSEVLDKEDASIKASALEKHELKNVIREFIKSINKGAIN